MTQGVKKSVFTFQDKSKMSVVSSAATQHQKILYYTILKNLILDQICYYKG